MQKHLSLGGRIIKDGTYLGTLLCFYLLFQQIGIFVILRKRNYLCVKKRKSKEVLNEILLQHEAV